MLPSVRVRRKSFVVGRRPIIYYFCFFIHSFIHSFFLSFSRLAAAAYMTGFSLFS